MLVGVGALSWSFVSRITFVPFVLVIFVSFHLGMLILCLSWYFGVLLVLVSFFVPFRSTGCFVFVPSKIQQVVGKGNMDLLKVFFKPAGEL